LTNLINFGLGWLTNFRPRHSSQSSNVARSARWSSDGPGMSRRGSILVAAQKMRIRRIKVILVLLQIPIIAFFVVEWNLELKNRQMRKERGNDAHFCCILK